MVQRRYTKITQTFTVYTWELDLNKQQYRHYSDQISRAAREKRRN